MPERFDVIVVGGGTAGCVLAARLSEDLERTVCLVEAGPDYGRHAEGRWPSEMLDARALPMSHLWETEPDDRSASRARIIGGCSAHNACLVVWGSRDDYDEWGEGWTFAELEPYLRLAEASIRTRADRMDDLSPFHHALLEAGPRIGLPRLADLNDLDATVGVAPAPVNALEAVRWNTAFAYLDDARSRPNLTIAPETLVDRVEIAGGRALGVVSDSGRLTANTVIVAAGAYGSPALLLRSGVGPHGQLSRLGIGVVENLPVGVGLADHPGVGIEWSTAAAHVPKEGPVFATSLLARARSDSCPTGTWDLHFLPWLEKADDGWRTSAVVYLLKPDSRGSVTLRAPDPRVPPRHRPRLPLRAARPRPPLERRRAHPRSCRASGLRTRAPSRSRLARRVSSTRGPGHLPPHRHLCDRDGRRFTWRRAGRGGSSRRGRLDHADDPAREHEPEHHRGRRTGRRLASRLSRSRHEGDTKPTRTRSDRDRTLVRVPVTDLRPALREHFGFDDFRPGQEEVVRAALAGRDTLALMPTGAGKSLTYQLAAMLRPSPTLVLSPLIALMKDQVDKLPARIAETATFVNSSLTQEEAAARLAAVSEGRTRLLYAAPERLRQESFVRRLRDIGVGLVVIDEVHCVSMWGHDFRPDYLFIRRALDALGRPSVLGMTATATPANATAIADALGRELGVVRTSVHRPNLRYDVERAENAEERLRAILRRLRALDGAPAIVYARSRRSCEDIARTLVGHGVRAEHYHAGLDADERTRVQEAFISGRTPVVVATTAFGMGIDKADVRLVALVNYPDSLESYVQMVGRAGRDGAPSDTVLLAGDADCRRSPALRAPRRTDARSAAIGVPHHPGERRRHRSRHPRRGGG